MATERTNDLTLDELKTMIAQIADERIAANRVQTGVQAQIAHLAPEHVTPEVLAWLEGMASDRRFEAYDEANDPTIGMISGPTDLARQASDILRQELGIKSTLVDESE